MTTLQDSHDLMQSPWLARLRSDLLEVTTPVALELWPSRDPATPFFNYRYEHVKHVERQALRLLRSEPSADADVVLAAVWLHDRFQPAFRGDNHGPLAASWARDNLPALGFSAAKTTLVCDCVERHSASFGELARAPIEPLVLWDADKLAHLGVMEVLLRLLNRLASDAVGERAVDPEYRREHSVLAHIWTKESVERFLKGRDSPDRFYCSRSIEIAGKLIAAQTVCLRSLLSELDETA